jgi:protease I
MKALILTADGFEDSELIYPYYRLKEEGFEVDIAGPKACLLTGKYGYTFRADKSFANVLSGEYDVLILPGGRGPEVVRLDDNALNVTREMFRANKVIGSICHGAQVLISAGLVKGRDITSWKGIRDDLKAAGALFEDRDVVVDGNLVTSRCPDDLPAFCREVMGIIKVAAR